MSSAASIRRLMEPVSPDGLAELALDLRWSFNHAGDKLWQRLDPELWEMTRNPWIVLQTVSRERLQAVTAEPDFQKLLATLQAERLTAERSEGWFERCYPDSPLGGVAYFSMEFMLTEALPIYSGGLGNVAGDQLKTASNLGVPVIGVGLLYQQGYFRQEIDADGQQQALYPFNDPGQLPIKPLREKDGEWLRFSIDFPGTKLWIRTWEVKVGRTRLYLMDTNDPVNTAANRSITSELYGGGPELRLKQEKVLGIGGWKLLRKLGIDPEVCHLNEGHAAFAVLERARTYTEDTKQPFDVALAVTRAGNLFTTHTPVEAGFDRFSPELMEKFFHSYAEKELSIPFQDLLALGRKNGADASESFNMAYLAFRGSGAINGVSRLHGKVSRRIFQGLFPRWPEFEVPISHVTNGVHVPTWDSAIADLLWENSCGKERWRDAMENVSKDFRAATDSELWQLRAEARKALVEYIRKRYSQQLAGQRASCEEIAQAAQLFDADTLTLGFARRFAPYKRPNLLLHDPQRLVRILANHDRPVQLVLAGKAHPQDLEGQKMIRQWIEFSRRPEMRGHVVFLSDYDALMAENLVQGVDVWLNTPRRPWEASGTSGMKVLVNGGLNVSELDGWWAEAYSPEVGWAIGDGQEHDGDPSWDAAEAQVLYNVLEQQVIPEFYTRNEKGIPVAWVTRMRESMARLTPTFSANRVVRQYTEEHYLPAAQAYCARAGDRGRLAAEIVQWQAHLAEHWPNLRFGSATADHSGRQYRFQVQVYLDDLDPEAVRVELYAEGKSGEAAVLETMARGAKLIGSANGFLYTTSIPDNRSIADYTPRVVPYHRGALVPLEASFICWHESPSWR